MQEFDKSPVVIGVLDANGRVGHIAGDVAEFLGYEPSECVGTRAVSIVHEQDRSLLNPETERMELRLQHQSGVWIRAAVVLSSLHPPEPYSAAFVITAPDPPTMLGIESRVATLEVRLRRIALEAAAAAADLGGSEQSTAFDESAVARLSPKQADIAQRLVAGKRVPTIARDIGLSQSTVRNHLSQIFRKFDVASQAELIEVLQRGDRHET